MAECLVLKAAPRRELGRIRSVVWAIWLGWCGVASLLAHTPENEHSPEPLSLGLSVKAGLFQKSGESYRGIGVNYFDCFMQTLTSDPVELKAAEARYQAGFAELKAFGIPFVRFNAGGFYPKDWLLYQQDPNAYFTRFDALVAEAEKQGIGLIPSLFWSFFTIPALAEEAVEAWGDTESKTHALMRRYTEEVVRRYRHSPAIWAWEFGNEYNLDIDLPNQAELWRKWFHPQLGMPASPRENERLSGGMMREAWSAFAKVVRGLDATRPVFSGNAMPRSSAWHLREEQSWTVDTRDEWIDELVQQNPDPMDALSVHFYPFHRDGGVGLADDSVEATLVACVEAARRSGKPLWMGECAHSPEAEVAERAGQLQHILSLLEKHEILLASVWVYDFAPQPELSLSGENENRPLLEMLGKMNQRWQEREK